MKRYNHNIVKSSGITPSGIAYVRPKLTGQTTSYRTGDDYWQVLNNPYNPAPTNPTHIATLVDNVTLAQNNVFGNTNRFTDQSGNPAFIYPLVNGASILTTNTAIDHYTGLEWGIRNAQSGNNKSWENAIDECLSLNIHGYDDWYLPNIQEWMSVSEFKGNGLGLNVIFTLGVRTNWSSTTDFADSDYAVFLNIITSTANMISRSVKVTNRNYYPVRKRY